MKHPIFRLKRAYIIGFSLIVISVVLEQLVSQYALYQQKKDGYLVALAVKEQILQQQLVKDALLLANASDTSSFHKHQQALQEEIPEWKQVYDSLQNSSQLFGEDDVQYSNNIQALFIQIRPYFEGLLENSQALAKSSFGQNPYNQTLVQQLLQHESGFLHSLKMIAHEYEKESAVKYQRLRNLELFFSILTLIVIAIQIIFLFRPVLLLIKQTFNKLSVKEKELASTHQELAQRLEMLEDKQQELKHSKQQLKSSNEELKSLNKHLETINDELEESHLHERELRAMAELAQKEAQKHREEFYISYQELKATEQELRHYTEELEQMNKMLADANVRAVELQIELEDALKREKAQTNELQEAYQVLKKTQSSLIQAEKMASLGQLVEGIAHELNNPMNFVSGGAQGMLMIFEDIKGLLNLLKVLNEVKSDTNTYSQQLQKLADAYNELDWENTKEDLEELSENIKTGVRRSSAIVQSLHSFAKTDADNYGVLHLSSSIDDIWNLLGKQTEGVELVKSYQKIPMVECNARGIHQALMHLLKNAVDAVNAIPDIKNPSVQVKLWEEGDLAYVRISDNGEAIPQDIERKIFEPFFTTKEVGQGMGLGLSISYNILKEHNGNIELHRHDGWKDFTISLPVSNQSDKE